jgi:hypothetical protein
MNLAPRPYLLHRVLLEVTESLLFLPVIQMCLLLFESRGLNNFAASELEY